MLDDSVYKKIQDAIKKRGEKPASERIANLQARGVIDKDGKVLIRMPSPPKSIAFIESKDGKSSKPGREEI